MNKIKSSIHIMPSLIIFLMMFMFQPSIFASDEVVVSIGNFQAKEGDEIDIPIEILNSLDVAGGYVEIEYDKSIVNVVEVREGDFPLLVMKIEKDKGIVSIAAASHTAIKNSKAILAVIKFTSFSSGTSLLKINYAELNDETGKIITPKVINGMITVQEKENIMTATFTYTHLSTLTLTHTQVLTTTQTITVTHETSPRLTDVLTNILPYILLIIAVIVLLMAIKVYKS